MEISNINIFHYRSLRELSLSCESLVVLLGPNNHGKSNILKALNFALSTSEKPTKEDFFAYRKPEENQLWVELTFKKLTEDEKITFQKYLLEDESIVIRKTATLADGKVECSYNGHSYQPNDDFWFLKEDGNILKLLTQRLKLNATPLKGLVPEVGKLSQEQIKVAQQEYLLKNKEEIVYKVALEEGPLLGAKNVAGGLLPEFFLVPAIREVSEETKTKSTSLFGRLLDRAVKEMAENNPTFIEIREKLETLIATLNKHGGADRPKELSFIEESLEKELKEWAVKVSIEVLPPSVEKILELGTNLHLDDGLRTFAEEKGHGLQRSLVFALMKVWSKILRELAQKGEGKTGARKASNSVIFAIEEPELFLHPHAQRRLNTALKLFSDTEQHQVFLCTHSPHFIDLSEYKGITIVNKYNEEEGSTIRQCLSDLFAGDDARAQKERFNMAYWIDPNRGEMFFAKKVVFVEGQTEDVALPFLAKKLECDDPEVSLVNCGGVESLQLYTRLANAFKFNYVVVHDLDIKPLDTILDEAKKAEQQQKNNKYSTRNIAIATTIDPNYGTLITFGPDFETEAKISKNAGEIKGKPLAAIEHFSKIPVVELPPKIVEMVRAIYS